MKPHIYFCFGEWRACHGIHYVIGRTPHEAYRFLWKYLYMTKDAIPPPKPYRAAAKP